MKINITIFLFILIVCSISCKQEEVEPNGAIVDYNYYPLDSGRYWIYQVDKTNYNIVTTDTTYFIKELVFDTYNTSPGVETSEMYRYYKSNWNDPWPLQPDSVWLVNKTAHYLSRLENNAEYLRLVFPATINRSWNGNALNGSSDDTYRIKNKGISKSVGPFNFSETLQVEEESEESLINADRRSIYYAKDVGPVSISYVILSYIPPTIPNAPPVIDLGDSILYTILDYGKP